MRDIQPVRLGVIARYFKKHKYNKERRELLMKALEASEKYTQEILLDEYVPYLDALPEIKTFLEEIKVKEAIKEKEEEEKKKELDNSIKIPNFTEGVL